MPSKQLKATKCPICNGRGGSSGFDYTDRCRPCNGTGVQRILVDDEGNYYNAPPEQAKMSCFSCEGYGTVQDPQHGMGQKCEPCRGEGLIPVCEVEQCSRPASRDRMICENHAFPAARPKESTGRRAAVLATRKKLADEAKVSDDMTDVPEEEINP